MLRCLLSFYNEQDSNMATITVLCPSCQSDKVVKFGKSAEGKQRFRCDNKNCKRTNFMLDYTYNGHKPGVKENIINMALNASGIRDTARVLKISVNTVIGTIKKSQSIRKRQPKILRST